MGWVCLFLPVTNSKQLHVYNVPFLNKAEAYHLKNSIIIHWALVCWGRPNIMDASHLLSWDKIPFTNQDPTYPRHSMYGIYAYIDPKTTPTDRHIWQSHGVSGI